MLTTHEQEQILKVVRFGCDRHTACDYVDCTYRDLLEYAAYDHKFHRKLRNAEANAEVRYMKVLHDASQEGKNWRIATWWFERRAPERFNRRAEAFTREQLQQVVDELTLVIEECVTDDDARKQLYRRLGEIADGVADGDQQEDASE